MVESAAELKARVKTLEWKLHTLKRDFKGLADKGKDSLTSSDEDCSFEARLESSESDYQQFLKIWDELHDAKSLAGESFPDKTWLEIYDSLRAEIINARATFKRIQRQRRNDADLPNVTQATTTMQGTLASARAHLPKIQIPQFNGDITKWSHFKDTFTSLVHNEDTLTNVEKFHYLLGALRGEAAALISNFPIEDGSYKQAWEKLCKTFGNTRVLASLLIQKIVDCDVRSVRNEAQRYDMFLTGVADSIQAFLALKLSNPTEFILSTLALRALDAETRRQFELTLKPDELTPLVEDVISFVRQRKIALKMSQDICSSDSSSSQNRLSTPRRNHYPNRKSSRYNSVSLHSTSEQPSTTSSNLPAADTFNRNSPSVSRCPKCTGNHHLSRCSEFHRLPSNKRLELVSAWRICKNCLSNGHMVNQCPCKFSCKKCKGRHHTLIHVDLKKESQPATVLVEVAEKPDQPQEQGATFTGFGTSTASKSSTTSTVLLGTARALIKGDRGDFHSIRALLDSGSQKSFVTSSLAKKIGADTSTFQGSITSLGESRLPQSNIKGVISCVLQTCNRNQQIPIDAVVVDKITSSLPTHNIDSSIIEDLRHQPLADYEFGESAPIDMLIGGDIYPSIIEGAPFPTGVPDLYLTPSIFGFVVSGKLKGTCSESTHTFFTEHQVDLERQLKAFWELEEPVPIDRTHPDDMLCEMHFINTFSRTPDGRYVVRLPLKQESTEPGCNRTQAVKRLLSLEQKFRRDQEFSQKYSEFMSEYLTLQHMSPSSYSSTYLIPHHGIWQEGPHGMKLRVVFDASCSSSVSSLNDVLHGGPKLQRDLSEILIRFRLYRIPLCADLVKMYRQILIHPDDRHLQHILWRDHPSEAVREFELNTVSYGVKSSAYQALRVIAQLVIDEGSQFPLAASRVSTDMYVDDIVSGADSIEEGIELRRQLCGMFSKGGFSLGKWASTSTRLMSPKEESTQDDVLEFNNDDCIKLLGLTWNSSTDSFTYKVKPILLERVTKRQMLSCTARLFDPLGLLAPVVFKAKSLIQDAWKSEADWDDELPEELAHNWRELAAEWTALSEIRVPRYVSFPEPSFQLVGFCDASLKGYAAVVYLRVENPSGDVQVSLIKAKTKVAPIKYVSISRLELCGALLLARLISSIPSQLNSGAICFSDSNVALSWLNTPDHALKVFEANRVSQTIDVVPARNWRHVVSEDNPADLASRGCSPLSLKENLLWWCGPKFLLAPIHEWFQPKPETVALTSVSFTRLKKEEPQDWYSSFSSYPLLIRTVARVLRWRLSSIAKRTSSISAEEFKEAELRLIRLVQKLEFPKEVFASPCPKGYSSLNPFLDERGLLRVGGRLQFSPLEYSAKHPILLPTKSRVSRLIVEHIHCSNFHAGPSLTLSLLRSRFWVPQAPKLIKTCIAQCVPCRLRTAKAPSPLMAPLPKERFVEQRAFIQVGVDYAGPFQVKESGRRNARIEKTYLCLFVCLSTKALHLELVTKLSTSAFLAALERFISRRGVPNVIWSDNGTNFVGASRFIKDIFQFQKEAENSISGALAPRGVEWKFIPPRAPHFGGLWEAGVKSVKRLLSSSLGKHPSTVEELSTAIARIEALLNSRPLCPLSNSVDNFDFLTPGHFLIGAPLCSMPEPSTDHHRQFPPRSRWEDLQRRIADVWERWRREYLHSLQQRTKWVKSVPTVNVGDLVILIEKRSSVGTWPVARVTKTFPGSDSVTRVVEVRTPCGRSLTRAVTSIAPLFHPTSAEEQKA